MSLKTEVLTGLKWSIIAKIVTQVFSWVSTFMVIRWLTPHDYGIMGVSMVFFTLISMFTTSGIIGTLVRQSADDKDIANKMFSLSLLVNALLSSLMFFAAAPIANAYQSAEIKNVLWIMSSISLLTSFTVVPTATLQRAMRFKEKAMAESISGLAAAVIAVVLAYYEYGYYALVISSASMIVVKAIALNIYVKHQYSINLKFKTIREEIIFALRMQVGTIVWYMYTSADNLIIGKLLGMEKAGIYSTAGEIASIPLQKFSSILNEVSFSAFNKIKSDPERATNLAGKASLLVALFMAPVFYGIASVSEEIVFLVLGEKWMQAATIIPVLCVAMPFRMVLSVWNNYIFGMGDSQFGLRSMMYTAIAVPTGVLIGALSGDLVVTAQGWLFATIFCMLITLLRAKQKSGASWWCMFKFIVPIIIASMMWVTIEKISEFMPAWTITSSIANVTMILSMKIVVGVVFSILILGPIYWKDVRSILSKKG